jgi:hypothetical protein
VPYAQRLHPTLNITAPTTDTEAACDPHEKHGKCELCTGRCHIGGNACAQECQSQAVEDESAGGGG